MLGATRKFGDRCNASLKPIEIDGASSYLVQARPRPPPISWVQVRDGPAVFLIRRAVVAWFTLIVAGLLEVVWAYSMKQSEGFSRLWPSIVTIVAMIFSFALLSWSMRVLPLGTAYTVWTGIGAVGAFLAGIILLGESMHPMRIAAAAMILGGLILMKLSSPA